jgi:hypothetical protein
MIGKGEIRTGPYGYRPRSGNLAFRIVQRNGASNMKLAVAAFGLALALMVGVTVASAFNRAIEAPLAHLTK